MARSDVGELLDWMNRFGFIVEQTKTHFKVRHSSLPGRYTMPMSPSDFRWLDNARMQMRAKYRGLDRAAWSEFPGRRGQSATTVRDSCTGTRIVSLLEDLVEHGERDFVGGLELDVTGRTPILTIRNPFYSLGSDDELRSQQYIELAIAAGNRKLSWAAVDALKDFGVDLELETFEEVQAEYLLVAREQRTLGIAEHEARLVLNKLLGDAYVGRATGRVMPEALGR